MSCSVLFCKSISDAKRKRSPALTFHTFPKCPEIRQKWIKAIRRDDWEPNKYSRLCSKHFEKSCFIDGLSIRKLKSDAVPTIFSDYPKYYQPATPKNKKRKIQENQSSNTDHDQVSPSDMKLIKELVKEQSKACRRLRTMKSLRESKRRLQKKNAELLTIIDVLEKGWKKQEQSFDILSSVGEQNKDIIPHLCYESKVFKKSSNMYEGLICICCLATENLVDLFSASNPNMEHTENYAEILEACFRIRVSQDEGHVHICEECIQQLKNSNNFKKQILNSISILTSVNVKQSIIKDEDMKNVDGANSQDNVSIKIEESDYEGMEPISETVDDVQGDAESCSLKELCRESSYITTPKGFRCEECGKIFSDNSILKMHQCVNYPKYQCELCGKDFMTIMALNNHSMTHDGEEYQCGNCSRTFSSLKLLGRHQESEHSNFDENCLYTCEYCDRNFSNLDSKDRHVQKEHEVVLYSCPLCSYKSKKQYLRSHMANRHHIGEKKHQCHYCKKKFSRGIGLKQHLRIHLDDRKYVCRVCNKNFVHKCSLKGHIQTHVRRGDYDGDPQELLDQSERSNEEYESIEDKIEHEDPTVTSAEESQDGMVEEFLMEDDELDEIRNALNQEGPQ